MKMIKFNFKEFRKKLESFNEEAIKIEIKRMEIEKNLSPKDLSKFDSPYRHSTKMLKEDYIKFNNKVLAYLEKTIPKDADTESLFSFIKTVKEEEGYEGSIYSEFIDSRESVTLRYNGNAEGIYYENKLKSWRIK